MAPSPLGQIIYGTAFFSGVEVYACCVMDNHLHILVHVPMARAGDASHRACAPRRRST